MNRTRSRWVSVVALIALIVSMIPVSASGVIATDGGASTAGVPERVPVVHTNATPRGIRLAISGLAQDVTGLDIYRSTVEGQEGAKLNSEPVEGASYVDEAAEAGVQYYYTVKVAGRKALDNPTLTARAWNGDTLAQVKADVIKAVPSGTTTARSYKPSGKTPPAKKAGQMNALAGAADIAAVNALATITTGTPDTTRSVSGTWSGVVFVRGDVVVPAGKTLTIAPGTKVYFDVVPSEITTNHSPTSPDPTGMIDLIVHGRLVAQGTATAPIVFTSVKSLGASATADNDLPEAGDYGALFFDSKAASVLGYCTIEYGDSVWAYRTNRPYIDHCNIRNMKEQGGLATVFYQDAVGDLASPQIRITNSAIVGAAEGVWLNWWNPDPINHVFNPYIVGNDIRADYCLKMDVFSYRPLFTSGTDGTYDRPSAPAGFGSYTFSGTISRNRLVTESGNCVNVELASGGAKENITVNTAHSYNVMTALSNTGGFYSDVQANGEGASVYNNPTFIGDRINAYGIGVEMYSYSNDSSGTALGHAAAKPKFTNCSIKSNYDYPWFIDVQSSSAGTSECRPAFSGGTFQFGQISTYHDYGSYAYAASANGDAISSPQFTNATSLSGDGYYTYNVWAEANTDGEGKWARANPSWVGGKMNAQWGDGIYAHATSNNGSAEAKPFVSRAEIITYEYCVEAYAYSAKDGDATGTATVAGTLLDSTLVSANEDCFYGYASSGDVGNAICSPYVENCSLTAENYYGLELEAYGYTGDVTIAPTVKSCDMWTYNGGVYAYGERYGTGSGVKAVTVSPVVTDSAIFAKYDDIVYLEAQNGAEGDALVRPKLTSTDLIQGYSSGSEFGLEACANVDSTGTADVSPALTLTNIKSDYAALSLSSDSGEGGVSKLNGTYTDCVFSSAWDDAVDMWCTSNGGRAESKPLFTRCTFDAINYYGYEGGVEGYGSAGTTFTAAPVFIGGDMSRTGDGIAVSAIPSGISESDQVCAPVVQNLPIGSAWDYAVYSDARSYHSGDAVNAAKVLNSPCSSYNGIYNYTYAYGVGDAINGTLVSGSSTKKMPVSSSNDYGVYNYTYSTEGGIADTSQVKYCSIGSYYGAVYSESYANGAAKTATVKPTLAYNTVTGDWGNDDDAFAVESWAEAAGGVVDMAPVISGNVIPVADSGVAVYTSSTGTKLNPVVTGNTISNCFDYGIEIEEGTTYATGTPVITRNKIDKIQYNGVYLKAPSGLIQGNVISNPGWGYSSTGNPEYRSGIQWIGAQPAFAQVRGNTITNARAAAVLWKNGIGITEYNSFVDAGGNGNRPYNVYTTVTTTDTVNPHYSARYNWWGTTNSAEIGETVFTGYYYGSVYEPSSDIIDYSSPLPTRQPKVKTIVKSKSGSTYTFKVTFDRPMDTTIKYLKFGKSSPYTRYKTKTGTWSNGEKTLTVKFSGSLSAGRYYFSGAKDLPGNTMLSTSKYFRP